MWPQFSVHRWMILQTQINVFCGNECDMKYSDYVPAPNLFTPSPLYFIRESLLLGIYSYALSVLGCLLCTIQTHLPAVASSNNTAHFTRWHYNNQVQHYLYKQPSPEPIQSSVHNLHLIHQATYWYYNPICIFQEFLRPPPTHWPLQHDLWRNNTYSYHVSLLRMTAHHLFILKDHHLYFSNNRKVYYFCLWQIYTWPSPIYIYIFCITWIHIFLDADMCKGNGRTASNISFCVSFFC